ncbi:redox-sensitive transcriptional activator SoxR [Oceanicola granulosus HTCC2516]|uniref:Redox-sensitive transcriptional activator SoxR n=1 Tax=Oceanicola granulosus (strain ATCC BAA-861 / DSM 15982 / KCTC 12143 / HTCC2516) TaxID=314256 RepID=Q2CHW9_OCEGH|nr:redox-sensitive transcriptional activator SoxR [Oceanicola granulosus]EAR52175.1 redox-sensitive transcriptional activator SoxR [Oceanicola granulosus HTCC2516]
MRDNGLTIGDLAARTGLAVSAIRFYETHGIVQPVRNAGGHRRYGRADIRRLSFAMIAQRLGFPLAEIAGHLARFPAHKALTAQDWAEISRGFRGQIEARIAELERLRDKLDGCIGCGCLSLERCALYNPDDRAAARGPGPRHVIDAD